MPDPIDPGTGRRIDDDGNNSAAQLAQVFTEGINKVKRTIEQRGGQVPDNADYVVVEKGDCLWTIAEKYGVDPATLVRDNRQFQQNPDLIHPGDIVLVRSPNTIKTGTQQPGSPEAGQPGAPGAEPVNFPAGAQPLTYDGAMAILKNPQSTPEQRQAAITAYLQTVPEDKRDAETKKMKDGLGIGVVTATTWDRNAISQDFAAVEARGIPKDPVSVPADPLQQVYSAADAYGKSPTDANKKALQSAIEAYLGPLGSPGYWDRMKKLQERECGNGPISDQLPDVFGNQLADRPGEQPATNLRSNIYTLVSTFLDTIAPGKRDGAVDTLLSKTYLVDDTTKDVIRVAAGHTGVDV